MLRNIFTEIRQALERFWKSRYRNFILVTLFFLIWIFFLSPDTVGDQLHTYRELKGLRKTKAYYLKEIQENERQIRKFKSDLDFVETYGREQYLMKKDNEDIFLFVEEDR